MIAESKASAISAEKLRLSDGTHDLLMAKILGAEKRPPPTAEKTCRASRLQLFAFYAYQQIQDAVETRAAHDNIVPH